MKKNEIIRIVVIAVVAIIALLLLKGGFDKIKDFVNDKRIARELDNKIDKKNLSYTDDQYESYCKKLVSAMDGIGTDDDAVYDVFRAMKTRSDVLNLIKVFGSRDGETLQEWLYGDLSSGEIQEVNKILKGLNIEYSF